MDPEAQKRAIIDKLTGAPAGALPRESDLDEPWRTIYRRIERAAGPNHALNVIVFTTKGLEDKGA